MSGRFQFNLKKFDRKVGPLGHAIAGVVVGGLMSLTLMFGKHGSRPAFEPWPVAAALIVFFGIMFPVLGLLEPYIERRQD